MEGLQYAAGLFDSDGCVVITHKGGNQNGSVVVSYHQAERGWGALNEVHCILGGTLYNQKTTGNRQQQKQLQIVGSEVAAALAAHSHLKTKQLEFAAQYVRSRFVDDMEELAAMKKEPHATIVCPLQIPYVAGFFDGDGCVVFRPKTGTVCAEICQKFPAICEAFKLQFGGSIYKGKDREQYTWHLGSTKAVDFYKRILPFLHGKKRQVEIIFEYVAGKLTPLETQQGLRALKGICSRTVYGKRKAEEIVGNSRSSETDGSTAC